MSDFLDTMATAEIDYTPEQQDRPPYFWWHNGDKKSKTPGSFYTKLAELGDAPGDPWQSDDRFDGEEGYSVRALHVAVIGYKMQAFTEEGEGRMKRKIWHAKWEKGRRLYTEVLCFVEGISGPVVWACKGLTGKAITGKGAGILSQYRETLLKEAEKRARKAVPPWSFWLPITSAVDASGKTVYTDTGFGSFVTLPALDWGKRTTDELINQLFVGGDLLADGARIRKEYETWLKTPHTNEASDDGADDEEAPPPPRRNVPQPISEDAEDDMPF
jgi:hypothetical protein